METVDIDFGPAAVSYERLEDALAASRIDDQQTRAKNDTSRIGRTVISDGFFGDSSCLIAFENSWNLIVEARNFQVEWKLSRGLCSDIEGAAVKQLRLGDGKAESFDPMAMLSSIVGSEFVQLAVTGRNFLVYTKYNEIFWFSACRNKKDGSELLYVCFET